MTDEALFQQRGSSNFLPTSAAVGPWDAKFLHGAAVAALFAGQLAPEEHTLARLTIEILAPVPLASMTLERHEVGGGSRVQRQDATLSVAGRVVATAKAVTVRRGELDLPEKALDHPNPFGATVTPALDSPNRAAEARVGWESFDSRSLVLEFLPVPDDRRSYFWISLAVPVVEGTQTRAIEIAAVAADYAQSAVNNQLPYKSWSFRNAELTLHLAREPVGSWIGIGGDAVVAPVGTGFNTADLYDLKGRMGLSAATLVVEHR